MTLTNTSPNTVRSRDERIPFTATVDTVTAADLGPSLRPGCPIEPGELRALTVTYCTFAGETKSGTLIVHDDHVKTIREIMEQLYVIGFPFEQIVPVSEYDGSDVLSMAANNTHAFNGRVVAGTDVWSEHAYGRAIDINPVQNPWTSKGEYRPSAGRQYGDRTQVVPGMIVADGPVVAAFTAHGWGWGGSGAWGDVYDNHHFSSTGD